MSNQFFSLVLLDKDKPVDAASIASRLTSYLEPIGSALTVLQGSDGVTPAIFEVGGVRISIKLESNPVPAGTFDTAVKFSIAWPNAQQAVSNHSAHLIVGCLEMPNNHEQALHFAVMNSLTTAAVLEAYKGTGVYWSTAQLLIAPDTFRNTANSILNRQLPVEDWINLFWIKGQTGSNPTVGCVTEGASAFIGMEIEFLPAQLPPAELAQRIFGVFRYLLANGAVLNDGDTLGQSETEMIRVHFRDRGLHFDGRVLQLSFEGKEPQRSKQPLPGLGGKPYSTPPAGSGRPRKPFGKRGR